MAMSVIHSSEAGSSSSSSSSTSNSTRTGGAMPMPMPMGDIITSSRPFHYTSTGTMPLVSRLDRLDYMMKFLKEKRDGRTRSTTSSSSQFAWKKKNVPLDLAIEDAQSRGSLLDRVIVLENQLTQLCLEMESRGASLSLGGQTSELYHDTSSSKPYDGKGGFPLSLPKFWTSSTSSRSQHYLKKQQVSRSQPHPLQSQVIGPDTFQIPLVNDIKSSTDQHHDEKKKPSKHEAASARQSRKTKEEISSSIRPKKTAPPTWPHLRFLGC